MGKKLEDALNEAAVEMVEAIETYLKEFTSGMEFPEAMLGLVDFQIERAAQIWQLMAAGT